MKKLLGNSLTCFNFENISMCSVKDEFEFLITRYFGGTRMEGINPKTLKDKIRLSKCLKLKKYAPGITDEKIKEIYDFLKNPKFKVILTREMLYFINNKDKAVKAFVVTPSALGQHYDRIELSTHIYDVMTFTAGSSSGSGCSGCSSNNNNNNNNNG